MSTSVFVALMLGIIAFCCILSIPVLMAKRCPNCRVRNGLDAKACKRCQAPFPDDPPP